MKIYRASFLADDDKKLLPCSSEQGLVVQSGFR